MIEEFLQAPTLHNSGGPLGWSILRDVLACVALALSSTTAKYNDLFSETSVLTTSLSQHVTVHSWGRLGPQQLLHSTPGGEGRQGDSSSSPNPTPCYGLCF